MSRIKTAGAAFILTILLLLCAFGFWLADYQSGKIAFGKHDTRIDIAVTDEVCEMIWRENAIRISLPAGFREVIETGQKFLPPDVQGVLYWLSDLNK